MSPQSLKPFPFQHLKKFSSQEAEWISRLTSYFPGSGFEPPVLARISEVMKKYFGHSFSLTYESLFDARYEKFIAGLPERFVCCVVSLTPLTKKVIIELDFDLVFAMIDRLLGGEGDVPLVLRSITPLEEGVLEFVLVRILKEISSRGEDPVPSTTPFQYRFDRILTKKELLSGISEENEPVILLTFRVRLNKTDGYLRLCLPSPILLKLLDRSSSYFNKTSAVENAYEERRWKDFEHFMTVVWAELGRVNLTVSELKQLQKGDIVIMEDSFSNFDGKKISGKLKLRMGDGLAGGIDADIVSSEEKIRLKLDHLFHE